MIASKYYLKIAATCISLLFLYACSNTIKQAQEPTLADIDTKKKQIRQQRGIAKKSQEEIRKAYRTYVENAADSDISRQKALTRLAQLELELSNSLVDDSQQTEQEQDAIALASLNRTITLLETTLRDYPKAKGNDTVLYQLAQAYDRANRYQDSIRTLEKLTNEYPQSLLYSEAQFRIAESAFVQGDYIRAEDGYTEVILTPTSEKFYEKSLFKRGWSRYKQQLYSEALDDYADAMEYHNFKEQSQLTESEKTQFGEYLRAISLAFSYQGRAGNIAQYFEDREEDFPYVYEVYGTVSDIYLQQERFSDAATILEEYAQTYPNTINTPEAELKIVAAWQQGKFTAKLYQAIERFYQRYQPKAAFWKTIDNDTTYKLAYENLRAYIVQISGHFHKRYQNKRKPEDLQQANLWYERYLKNYSAYANKDNIFSLYGELLLVAKRKEQAQGYFIQAAYDGNLILDKKAAYTTIVLSDQLFRGNTASKNGKNGQDQKNTWLDQHLTFAERFIELYPEDNRVESIALRASEHAFNSKNYSKTIDIANHIPDRASEKARFDGNTLKARAYLEQKQFSDAEVVYLELLDSKYTRKKAAKGLRDSLALAIYRQAETSRSEKQTDLAINHFTRITTLAPQSQLAATGLYDAIALAIESKRWDQSIGLIKAFQSRYPKHKYTSDLSKKLSVAYLNSDQKGKAAQEFERIAQFEENLEVKIAAQWQAAQLYETKNDTKAAIRAYRDFAHTYKKPYAQNIEAMYKLTELYKKQGDIQRRYFWQTRIRRAEQKASKRDKTERTTFIASTMTLDLARQKRQEFARTKLVEPIAKNLKKKKETMQDSVKLFGQASAYGIEEITTESTAAIGDIYLNFSQALLESERPSNLNTDELEQYEILLEDQAFPFEEKAIEFYEANLARTQDGTYNAWIARSFDQLLILFPVRYQRKGKLNVFQP